MPARGAALAAIGLVLIAGGLLAVRNVVIGEPGRPDAAPAAHGDQPAPPAATFPEKTGKAAMPARPVSPDTIAPPRVEVDELQRVEPREALSRFGQPLPKPLPRHSGLVHRPVVEAAGRVAGSGVVVTLKGVEVTPPDKICTDARGREWPCGLHARGALRGFVRGRALACDLPAELSQPAYTVACTLGGRDVGLWLVEQGLALPSPGSPYGQAAADAREAHRGLHGDAPAPAGPAGQADAAVTGDASPAMGR